MHLISWKRSPRRRGDAEDARESYPLTPRLRVSAVNWSIVKAGIIAAGTGERLLAAGITTPKPLIEVAGKPLVDHVLDVVAAAGIDAAACIFNAEPPADAVEAHCRQRRGAPQLTIVRRTTPSSMESLFTLAPQLAEDRFLLLTVDALFPPSVLRDFLGAAARHADADAVLALTTHIDDEKPLYAGLDDRQRVTSIGPSAHGSAYVTAGFYVFSPRIFAEIDAARAARFTALRQFLAHLLARGYSIAGVEAGKTLDVDRPQDIAAATDFVRSFTA